MDWDAFTDNVWDAVNDGIYFDQWGSLDDSNPDGDYTGIVYTIGETWDGVLFGTEENNYGQRAVYQFDTKTEQRQWFEAVTVDAGPNNW
jgi:hypothetical protein